MPQNASNVWFESWFNSPYYHLLYKNRDQCEANNFIDNLLSILHPKTKSHFLDLACGKGRHALFLNQKGFDVTGIDLSPENIVCASNQENDFLHFYVHDMRKLFRTNYYDYVLNLFTSFGYFENDLDDLATIQSVSKGLKPNGKLVIDFMNTEKVKSNLIANEEKKIDGVHFFINRSIENNFIIKRISISDKGKEYHFKEKVKALTQSDFEKHLNASRLKIVDLRGDYELEKFDKARSDRLIIIAEKE